MNLKIFISLILFVTCADQKVVQEELLPRTPVRISVKQKSRGQEVIGRNNTCYFKWFIAPKVIIAQQIQCFSQKKTVAGIMVQLLERIQKDPKVSRLPPYFKLQANQIADLEGHLAKTIVADEGWDRKRGKPFDGISQSRYLQKIFRQEKEKYYFVKAFKQACLELDPVLFSKIRTKEANQLFSFEQLQRSKIGTYSKLPSGYSILFRLRKIKQCKVG